MTMIVAVGLHVTLDLNKPPGQRVVEVRVRTKLKQRPSEYPELDPAREYIVAAQSVTLTGGYSNPDLSRLHGNRTRGGIRSASCAAAWLS